MVAEVGVAGAPDAGRRLGEPDAPPNSVPHVTQNRAPSLTAWPLGHCTTPSQGLGERSGQAVPGSRWGCGVIAVREKRSHGYRLSSVTISVPPLSISTAVSLSVREVNGVGGCVGSLRTTSV